MESTVQSPPERAPRAEPSAWVLVVAHHPAAERVGSWRVVAAGETLVLGRARDALGAGVLDDETLSREHARIWLDGGELRVRDAGSRNGTWVNGARIDAAPLRAGDVIELGALLVQAIRPARPPVRVDEPELSSISGAMAAVVDDVRRLAAQRAARAPGAVSSPVVLAGETGVGKSALAALLHRLGGGGPWAVLRCATVLPDLAAAELHGVAAAAYPGAVARDGALARAHGGTLVLDGLDDAAPSVQGALRAFLEDPALRPVGAAADAGRPLDVQLVATVRAPGRLLPELASRLERVVVRVPPLRERVEDLGPLLRAAFTRRGRTPSKRLALALLRHPWPLNAGELDGLVARACLDSPPDDGPVPLGAAASAHLGITLAAGSAPDALAIARDGSWLQPPGGDRISLRRRENLGLLLRALATARTDDPGRTLSIEALFRAGWPDQRIDVRAAAGRVYVALTSLRNLGLRDVLLRRDDGYLLDPAAAIELIE